MCVCVCVLCMLKIILSSFTTNMHVEDIIIFVHYTVEPRYNENLGTMKITLLYRVSCYIRGKKKI